MKRTILLSFLLLSSVLVNAKEEKTLTSAERGKDCVAAASYTMSLIEDQVGCFDDPECYNELWQIYYDHCRDSMYN